MGSVIKLSKKINNSYLELKKSVEDKLVMVDERIEQKLQSNVDLVKKCHHTIWILVEKN